MARPGITYAQVAQSAEALTAAGTNPTIAAIRQAMGGTGSPNTIHKHLAAWKGERPQISTTAGHDLPARLMTVLQEEINQAKASARAEMETALQQAQAEAVELARAGEYIEAERDALLEQVEALKTERDQAAAIAGERAKEIAGLRQEITLTVKERTEAHERAAVMAAELKAAERRANAAEGREATTAAKLEKVETCIQMERQAAAEAHKPKAPAKTSAKPVKKGKKPEEANPEQDDKATLPIKF